MMTSTYVHTVIKYQYITSVTQHLTFHMIICAKNILRRLKILSDFSENTPFKSYSVKPSEQANKQISIGLPQTDSACFVLCGCIKSYTKGDLGDLLSPWTTPLPALLILVLTIIPACVYTLNVRVHVRQCQGFGISAFMEGQGPEHLSFECGRKKALVQFYSYLHSNCVCGMWQNVNGASLECN